ncbi:hypothetical protein [Sphingomonas sp.]|uniref:hypothetical protein n=1 Tax=Sphingomonas sp. TaxID=28214 RepID=UPI001EC3A455|nr:hypothetical protein [Sphingomonas sp.]MBX3592918.1 hypothetical protein [Sphingomonas sp.]
MRVASEATLKRAAKLRSGGKSWLQLTRTPQARQTGLDFFKGAKGQPQSGRAKDKK